MQIFMVVPRTSSRCRFRTRCYSIGRCSASLFGLTGTRSLIPFEINGQNSRSTESVVMLPTSPLDHITDRLPCDISIACRNEFSAALPSTSASTNRADDDDHRRDDRKRNAQDAGEQRHQAQHDDESRHVAEVHARDESPYEVRLFLEQQRPGLQAPDEQSTDCLLYTSPSPRDRQK